MATVDVICFSTGVQSFRWELGCVLNTLPQARDFAKAVEQLGQGSTTDAVLFWDASLGTPAPDLIQSLLASPAHCWHAGLRLGTGGLPRILHLTSPTWMLACDPPTDIEATSWRLSWRACLVRTQLLRALGGPRAEFQTLEAAALEMGHRWIRRGALMRHVPQLLPKDTDQGSGRAGSQKPLVPFVDELRFAYYRHGRKWAAWALYRAVVTRHVSLPCAFRSWREVMSTPRPPEPPPFRDSRISGQWSALSNPTFRAPSLSSNSADTVSHRPEVLAVSILIPTLDRYPYLRTLLGQLRQQTLPPLEIIIVDQTAGDRRQPRFFEEFDDLPLKVIYQGEPGQCTSRNAGLQMTRGEYILFLDDDDEVPADLLEKHLQSLAEFKSDVSCGVADEVGAGSLPSDFRFLRASDVFPTNNTMIRRDVLRRSGLFDLAYNRRQRADGDLGMRIYLAGASLILNPSISVLHHHAPSGGLRKHKARTVTYAMSRDRLFCRALASVSEFYLAGRYFPESHGREILWQSVLGTFSIRGNFAKRTARLLISAGLLPVTLWQLRMRRSQARQMAAQYPEIAVLS